MSTTKGEKFKTKFSFVKPLYRTARISNCENVNKSVKPYNFDRTLKLCGDDFNVKTVKTTGAKVDNVKYKLKKDYKVVLPGVCDSVRNVDSFNHLKVIEILRAQRSTKNNVTKNSHIKSSGNKMLENIQDEEILNDDTSVRHSKNNAPETFERAIVVHKDPERWLRVAPAPRLPEESVSTTILRCLFCQLGLITFLVLWTMLGVFVIQSFEGPQEMKISLEFENEQNQLVIDLATELRQITPLSPKWRNAIENRINDERKLTIDAVGEGARLNPGEFWNLPGTFLFAIYVMTALGFGAPVPHTVWGRSSALVYALLAVPTHIYLMVNASTCVVVRVEECTKYIKENYHGKLDVVNAEDGQERNRNSELMKSSNKISLRKNIIRCISILCTGRCIPLASIIYFIIGVLSFGVLRNKSGYESIMFPIEFTTTGGLERVEGFVRIFYGIYIEGAMCLFACVLATVRRHNNSTFEEFSQTFRLFDHEACRNCETDKGV